MGGLAFSCASFTDFLDGWLSRKWDAVSVFGKIFDPLADKLLVNGTLIVFMISRKVLIAIASILILRDLIMDLIRLVFYRKRKVIAAIKTAKYKTATQMAGLLVLIFVFPSYSVTSFWTLQTLFSQGLLFLSSVFSLVSFMQYIEILRYDGHN
ncbi:CDP-diacylglycerol--glycerol-3-phosphate 3-phosphatidyltransferase [Candidatus Mycoplasma haematobovis]|uniref:CDP-diacylglycerol--glycerol-3-phosphate 3-phosphatidyltransferase n=1 Tax=Candidatus Mycoplasma haematobovis TaxID=432608 RepID=UPI001FE1B878|nr:CDP-diacylglycerol--glycerol-3-phosphate 3-phosphatidyltransferase [Candidatus Mycoplasma haematobovis]